MAGTFSPILLVLLLLFLAVTIHTQQSVVTMEHETRLATYPQDLSDVESGPSPDTTGCNRNYWQACFFTGSDCLFGLPGVSFRRECFNETSNPSGQCHTFKNFASVHVDTQECEIYIYQDDNCQVLLQGSDTMFKPNEEFCWKKLTTDPERKRSKLRYQFFRFSGSWKVICPRKGDNQDCPPQRVDCPRNCVREQWHLNLTNQDG